METKENMEIGDIALLFLPLSAYTVVVLMVTFGLSKESYQFHLLSIVLGVISAFVIKTGHLEKKEGKRIAFLIAVPLLLAVIFRAIPYIDNSVPLGYDPGIYKYEIERYWKGLPEIIPPDLENWDRQWSPPGLFIITSILHLYGFNSFDHYNFLFIFFDVLVVLAIYAAGKRYFSQEAGIIAALFYSASFVQFRAFWLFYYKNVIAIFLALIAVYLFKSKKYVPLVITGVLIGAVHRPTFLVFGLIYLFSLAENVFSEGKKDTVRKFFSGCLILILAISFYIPAHMSALSLLKGVMKSTEETVEGVFSQDMNGGKSIGGGTFISSDEYHYSAIFYLPLAVSGAFIMLREKNFNSIVFWGIVTAVIVYLKLFFYNRFIIHLDIALLLLAGAGFYYLIKYSRSFGFIILTVLAITSIYSAYEESIESKPLITERELESISMIKSYDEDAYSMAITSYYSPWVIGYSGKKTIAPGLFEYNKWGRSEWRKFWSTKDPNTTAKMLRIYNKPVYIYIGEEEWINENKFRGDCFEKLYYRHGSKIYRFGCNE
jgi:hypothetical protein